MQLQKKLEFLLDKYAVDKKAVLEGRDMVKIGGKIVALLPWRSERRFIELRNLVKNEIVNGVSTFRILRIEHEGADLYKALFRELDLCEWILSDEVCEIFAIKNQKAMNVIAKLKSGVVCTLEIAATLASSAKVIDKHEIIAKQGVACDRVVDTQVPQSSIYVFGNKNEPDTYQDVDFELFGLSIDEIAIVRQAFEASKCDELPDALNSSAKHIEELVKLAKESIETENNIVL